MKLLNITLVLCVLALFSCKSKPKVIVEDATPASNAPAETPATTNTITADTTAPASNGGMHQVVALEILQAERYTYLKVKENNDSFWIATTKFDAKVGNQYFYRGGLLKTNFESQEHKKVFDKIFLVSEIIDAAAHPSTNAAPVATEEAHVHSHDLKNVAGAIKLSDLFANKQKYSGKSIIVAGKCVKANYGIMNKNWYHIQDGTTKDGKPCDFTVTSTENSPLGANIIFEGKLILNKDFGSGYKYDMLMEDGKLK